MSLSRINSMVFFLSEPGELATGTVTPSPTVRALNLFFLLAAEQFGRKGIGIDGAVVLVFFADDQFHSILQFVAEDFSHGAVAGADLYADRPDIAAVIHDPDGAHFALAFGFLGGGLVLLILLSLAAQ